ncbi:hypothetical protein ACVWXO_001622 [Bradyrhizobium sp. LM2.7]
MLLRFLGGIMRSLPECRNRRLIAIDMSLAVIARLDRAIQCAAAFPYPRSVSGILDCPPQCAIADKAGDDDQWGYAAPIKIPTASTMPPPSTIWNTA